MTNPNPSKTRRKVLGYLLITPAIIFMSFAFELYFKVTDARFSHLGTLEDELQEISGRESALKDFKSLLALISHVDEEIVELQAVIDELDGYASEAIILINQRRMDIEARHDNYKL
jgi:hypothetical protein